MSYPSDLYDTNVFFQCVIEFFNLDVDVDCGGNICHYRKQLHRNKNIVDTHALGILKIEILMILMLSGSNCVTFHHCHTHRDCRSGHGEITNVNTKYHECHKYEKNIIT